MKTDKNRTHVNLLFYNEDMEIYRTAQFNALSQNISASEYIRDAIKEKNDRIAEASNIK
ncbi:hypothetical protein AWB71_06002 [Caballeronia peredens]|nr:hypothetical protein AWB71_06002 [Caballeronia peredens]